MNKQAQQAIQNSPELIWLRFQLNEIVANAIPIYLHTGGEIITSFTQETEDKINEITRQIQYVQENIINYYQNLGHE